MTGGAISGRLALLLCVPALLITATASAQDDAFRKGFDARNDKRWVDVVGGMQQAIQIDPKESPRKIRVGGILGIGTRETEYLPFFYLGEAQFNRKNCVAAIMAWETSEQHGVVQARTDLHALMRDGYRACAAQGFLLAAELKGVVASTRQAYERANTLGTNVYGLMEKHPSVVRADMREQYSRAHGELTNANGRLTRGLETRSRSDFDEAVAAAERAADLLRPIEASFTTALAALSRIDRQIGELSQLIDGAETADRSIDEVKAVVPQELHAARMRAREQLGFARERMTAGQRSQNAAMLDEALKYAQSASAAFSDVRERLGRLVRSGFEQKFSEAVKAAQERFSFVDSALAALERLALERPTLAQSDLADRREAIRRDVEAQRRRFERARLSEDLAAVERAAHVAAEHRGVLDELIKAFGPVTLRDRGVHEALEQGARLFFQGDYRDALAALHPPGGLSDLPLQLHVHLFRAAASYALYALSGGTDRELRMAALKEIEYCKDMNSTFRPDPRMFSPAFISFYDQADATAQTSAPNSAAR